MTAQWFDAYSQFLDLPDGERPPHYYELLGLELFCAHPERIEHAVRKQFRRIKPFEEHPDRATREAIQDVMTRIAQAQGVLTDSDKRTAYDAELAQRLGIDRDGLLASRMAARVPEYALTVTAGPGQVGDCLELAPDTTFTLGRDPQCVLALASTRIGLLHGQLRCVGEHWTYSHMDKSRLSLINEERTSHRLLEDGDGIAVGGYMLRFARIARRAKRAKPPGPPITLIITKGPSVPDAIFHALAFEETLIGNDETALWQLPDAMVSRHHCRITGEGGQWAVRDLGSTNHTLVNGRRIAAARLGDQDTMTLGRFDIKVRIRA